MPRQITATWNVETLEDTIRALSDAQDMARVLGHHPSTVYPNMERVRLTEKTLTDGSTVMDVEFSNKPDAAPSALWDRLRAAEGRKASAMPVAPAPDPIGRLLDCLKPWADGKASVIYTNGLAEDEGDETIVDLIRAAVAARTGEKA